MKIPARRFARILSQAGVALSLFIIGTMAALGGTFNFEPIDDAYLQGSTLYNNDYLRVRAGSRVCYLKFAVEGLSQPVHAATLRLQENGDTGSGTLRFFRGSHNDWTETNLSTTNAPAEADEVGTFTGPVRSADIIHVEMTSLVDGDGTYSIIMKQDPGGTSLRFGSRESTRKPVLIIETTNTLTVINGSGSGNYVAGEVVDIVADDPLPDLEFDQWTGDIEGVADVNAPSTSITIPGEDATITATYKPRQFILTVNSGSGSGSYATGETVDIVADDPPAGEQFVQWTGDVEGVADVNAASTSITIPRADATITATYTGPQHTLTVNNGSGSGDYAAGVIIDIVADPAPAEQEFDEWTGDLDGIADIHAPSTTFSMPATDATITATYKLTEGIGDVGPLDGLTATGDRGLITSINRIPVSGLLLGMTTFPNASGPTFPAENADSFDLNTLGSADSQPYFDCSFTQAVMTIFIIENGGNDSGIMRGLNAAGTPVGPTVSFTTNSFFRTPFKSGNGQDVAGLAVRMTVPVHGIRVFPPEAMIMGFDPISISASVRPWLQLQREPADDGWRLIWFGADWVLQHASGPNAEWSDVSPTATSPHPVVPGTDSQLFRLKQAGP